MPIFACLGTDVTWTFSIQSSNFVIKFDIQFGTLALQHSTTLELDNIWLLPLHTSTISSEKRAWGGLLFFIGLVPVITPWSVEIFSFIIQIHFKDKSKFFRP